jgi:hypothetical protein
VRLLLARVRTEVVEHLVSRSVVDARGCVREPTKGRA